MTKNKDVSYEQLVAASHVLIAANFKESGNYPSEAMIRETVAKVRIACPVSDSRMDDAVSYLLIRYPTVTCDYSVIFKSHGEWLWSRTHGNLEDAEAEVAFAKNLYKEVMLLKDTSPQMAYRACSKLNAQIKCAKSILWKQSSPVSWHSSCKRFSIFKCSLSMKKGSQFRLMDYVTKAAPEYFGKPSEAKARAGAILASEQIQKV